MHENGDNSLAKVNQSKETPSFSSAELLNQYNDIKADRRNAGSGLVNISDDQRKYIENSLHLKTSVNGYLGTGVLTGAAVGAGSWYLDHKLLNLAAQPSSGVLGWWKDHSPTITEPGTPLARTFNGAVKGLEKAGATLVIGYALDKTGASLFGYKKPETDGVGRFLLDGVAVPAVLLSDMSARAKFALAGTAFVSARIGDYAAGTGASVQISTLLRPNTCDGILMTAGAMAPVDPKTRAMLVAGAWVEGRVYNAIAHLTGLDGGDPAALRDNSNNALSHDQVTHTEESFDNAVTSGKALGKENEMALELQMRDWLASDGTRNPNAQLRGTAALADALGQFRLDEGNRLDPSSHQNSKARTLKGYNYDFGGEATTWLRMAAGSLVQAQDFANTHKGQTIDGQAMDDRYVQQLKNEQAKVEAKLDLIYGAHDINDIYSETLKQTRVNSTDMAQAIVRIKGQLEVLKSNDSRFVAKSSRDLALAMFAQADNMSSRNNGEEARIMYLAADQYLQNAARLDANAPDNKALQNIKSTLASRIAGLIREH